MRNNSALLSVTGSDNITTCLMRPLIADTYVRQGRAIRLTLTYKVTIDKRNYIKSVGITVTSSSLSLHHVCLIYRYRNQPHVTRFLITALVSVLAKYHYVFTRLCCHPAIERALSRCSSSIYKAQVRFSTVARLSHSTPTFWAGDQVGLLKQADVVAAEVP